MKGFVDFFTEDFGRAADNFDEDKVRPRCKVCGRPAWLNWNGKYSDHCTAKCREEAERERRVGDRQRGSKGSSRSGAGGVELRRSASRREREERLRRWREQEEEDQERLRKRREQEEDARLRRERGKMAVEERAREEREAAANEKLAKKIRAVKQAEEAMRERIREGKRRAVAEMKVDMERTKKEALDAYKRQKSAMAKEREAALEELLQRERVNKQRIRRLDEKLREGREGLHETDQEWNERKEQLRRAKELEDAMAQQLKALRRQHAKDEYEALNLAAVKQSLQQQAEQLHSKIDRTNRQQEVEERRRVAVARHRQLLQARLQAQNQEVAAAMCLPQAALPPPGSNLLPSPHFGTMSLQVIKTVDRSATTRPWDILATVPISPTERVTARLTDPSQPAYPPVSPPGGVNHGGSHGSRSCQYQMHWPRYPMEAFLELHAVEAGQPRRRPDADVVTPESTERDLPNLVAEMPLPPDCSPHEWTVAVEVPMRRRSSPAPPGAPRPGAGSGGESASDDASAVEEEEEEEALAEWSASPATVGVVISLSFISANTPHPPTPDRALPSEAPPVRPTRIEANPPALVAALQRRAGSLRNGDRGDDFVHRVPPPAAAASTTPNAAPPLDDMPTMTTTTTATGEIGGDMNTKGSLGSRLQAQRASNATRWRGSDRIHGAASAALGAPPSPTTRPPEPPSREVGATRGPLPLEGDLKGEGGDGDDFAWVELEGRSEAHISAELDKVVRDMRIAKAGVNRHGGAERSMNFHAGLLELRHPPRQALQPAVCSVKECGRYITTSIFKDLYEEEEFRIWGYCNRASTWVPRSAVSNKCGIGGGRGRNRRDGWSCCESSTVGRSDDDTRRRWRWCWC
eukprot:GHVU01067954.1.p1 GENE.GHVU01067954.1~~GHVU01067954.1.p1  ORF type:complete len:864 (+),score=171.97 GHVU01067954.1:3891-6482(+)